MKQLVLYIFCLVTTLSASAQDVLKGRVLDERTEEPIIGAAIQIKGTRNAAVTDTGGQFSITLAGKSPYTLVVTYTGYNQQDLEVYDASSERTAACSMRWW